MVESIQTRWEEVQSACVARLLEIVKAPTTTVDEVCRVCEVLRTLHQQQWHP